MTARQHPDLAGQAGKVTMLVVRHGRAEGNREHRFIGQSDVPLAAEGQVQAEALAKRLSGLAIARIVSSDLSRCADFVAPLAAAIGLPVERDARLREIANGEWTGHLPEEIGARWPELWTAYVSGEDVPRPGGETWSDVRSRTIASVKEIAAEAGEGDLVVICTHGGPALNLVTWAAGLNAAGNVFRGTLGPIANGSISTIRFPGPRLLGYNDVGHLGLAAVEGRPPYLPSRNTG